MMIAYRHAWRPRLIALLLSLACVGIAQAVDPVELPDPQLQRRYWDLSHELRCMQCQNQSIADSPVGLAGDLRREVRELLLAGKTDQQIRDHLVARYGDFILFRPQFSSRNAWLWLSPLVLLVIGLVVAVRIVRGRAKLVADGVDEETPDRPASEAGGPR
jgi:cytochrome c-type biogenesis protein CcmH